ncbi:MAG TPA: hypothetical protein VFG14_08275, partial [Chthoniobacteraceae bacterium]|nr:hypothetical protein [Chthoniobacteraceae bacterium]
MGKGRLRLLKTIPGPNNDSAILAEFCSRGDGLITALDSKHLATLRYAVPSESDVELLEFGRIVAKFARLADADPRPLAGGAHMVGAIEEACEGLDADSPFFGSRRFGGLHRRLADTIKELAAWGLESSTLQTLATECTSDLSIKLRSLADIWGQAEHRLAQFGCELSHKHVSHCLASEPDSDVVFPRCLVFLDGEFAPKHAEWLRWASEIAEVTVVVEGSPSAAELLGTSRVVETVLGPTEACGGSSEFVRSLFSGTIAGNPGLAVSRFKASDPLSEVEWALRQAMKLVESRDYHRVGLFARSMEDYGPLIEASALRLGIPVRISRRAGLKTNGFLKALCGLVSAMESGDVRRLGRATRSSYFMLTSGFRRDFEGELNQAFREEGSAWQRMGDWARANEEPLPWLPNLLAWRTEAMRATTMRAWRERLVDLGNQFPAISQGVVQERDLRAKNSFERALGVRASFLEDREHSLSEFAAEMEAVLDTGEYTLPSAAYGIQVSDAPCGFSAVDHLFVLGMLEGVFPRRRSESPVLTDADRMEISERRALLFPLEDSFLRARRERDSFVSLCSIPVSQLIFSYPETTDERDNIPAFYLEEAKRAVGGEMPLTSYPRAWVAPPLDMCLSENDQRLRYALDAGPIGSPVENSVGEVTRQKLMERVPAALSPRQLRSAFECPFRHFAQEILRLYPDRDSRRWYQLRMLPQEAQLMRQGTREEAESALRGLLDAKLEEMRPHTSEADWLLMRQGAERLVRDWVDREFRAREIWGKDSGSELSPVTFGAPTLRDELPRSAKIAGSVAGTSRMGPYKVVHMVESNTPSFERGTAFGLKDRDMLYYGIHMMAGFERGSNMALEVESMSGGRKLLLLPRAEEPQLVGDREQGL